MQWLGRVPACRGVPAGDAELRLFRHQSLPSLLHRCDGAWPAARRILLRSSQTRLGCCVRQAGTQLHGAADSSSSSSSSSSSTLHTAHCSCSSTLHTAAAARSRMGRAATDSNGGADAGELDRVRVGEGAAVPGVARLGVYPSGKSSSPWQRVRTRAIQPSLRFVCTRAHPLPGFRVVRLKGGRTAEQSAARRSKAEQGARQ